MEDKMVCGSWTIPYAEIESAEYQFPTSPLGASSTRMVVNLRIRSRGYIYDFVVLNKPFWRGALPFEVKRDEPAASSAMTMSKLYWLGLVSLVIVIAIWMLLKSG
jgi:hypothetical protein